LIVRGDKHKHRNISSSNRKSTQISHNPVHQEYHHHHNRPLPIPILIPLQCQHIKMVVECVGKITIIPNYFFVKCAMMNIIFIVLIHHWIEFRMVTFIAVSAVSIMIKETKNGRKEGRKEGKEQIE